MKINISKYTINQKLAIVAFSLGFLAIFMRDPLTARIVSIDVNELSTKIQDKSSNITVSELADWLIKKRYDFKLIDLRDEAKFNEYNIPSSINIKPSELTNMVLSKTEKIILYSDNSITSAQAWFVLKSKNYKSVYILSGGMNEWKDNILFPKIPDKASESEKAKFALMIEISKHFGGAPQMTVNDSTNRNSLTPKLVMPKISGTVPNASAAGKKPKREGC